MGHVREIFNRPKRAPDYDAAVCLACGSEALSRDLSPYIQNLKN